MNKIKDIATYTIITIVVLTAFFGLKIYSYKDCKKVGHSTFYCIINK